MRCEVLNGTWDEAEEAGAAARKPNVLWRANDSRDLPLAVASALWSRKMLP